MPLVRSLLRNFISLATFYLGSFKPIFNSTKTLFFSNTIKVFPSKEPKKLIQTVYFSDSSQNVLLLDPRILFLNLTSSIHDFSTRDLIFQVYAFDLMKVSIFEIWVTPKKSSPTPKLVILTLYCSGA